MPDKQAAMLISTKAATWKTAHMEVVANARSSPPACTGADGGHQEMNAGTHMVLPDAAEDGFCRR